MKAEVQYPIHGGCDCRVVRYRVTMKPLFVHCCHCRWCQRESGTAFALNAMIEADAVELVSGSVDITHTPSQSGFGQKIVRCPVCRVAVWSHYAGGGSLIRFVRVGTLDFPDQMPPDIHIFAESKQPWLQLNDSTPVVPQYYDAEAYWPAESLRRRERLLESMAAHRAALKEDPAGAWGTPIAVRP